MIVFGSDPRIDLKEVEIFGRKVILENIDERRDILDNE